MSTADEIDVIDHGAVEGKNALDALAKANLAHRDRGTHADVVLGDDYALKDL